MDDGTRYSASIQIRGVDVSLGKFQSVEDPER
jgi:hypothetical protein